MKKIFRILLSLIVVMCIVAISISAEETNEDDNQNIFKGPACQYLKTYSETIDSQWEDIQFTHIAEKNSVVTTVSRSVSTTSTFEVTGGYKGDVNFLLQNSSVHFELSYVGSRTTTTTITWNNIPANETHVLIAGKKMVGVTGKINVRETDCSVKTDDISVRGSTATFHRSYRQ